jgi:Mrp family chromosome partitioning ATPase
MGAAEVGLAADRNNIDRVVAVMSGKGGVGKSSVTGLLAASLTRAGYRVGVLDADITGPSIPKLFGLRGPVESGPEGIVPLQSRGGAKIISANLMVESEDMPLVWRGPLIGKAIKQLWGDVIWADLDYLLVDMPPGTSDVALTVLQALPVNGIVMVTTPQSLAAMIVRKAVNMARLLKVPIAGVVENMAYYPCPTTGEHHRLFGPSHAQEVAQTAEAPLLAQLPLDPAVAELCDAGQVEEARLPEMDALLELFVSRMPTAA